MTDLNPARYFGEIANPYQVVLAAALRCRQLMARAERHGMTVDVENVLHQSLQEVIEKKVETLENYDPTQAPEQASEAS